MKIVLYRPEIPQNTGNIGRLCVATKTFLLATAVGIVLYEAYRQIGFAGC